LPVEGVGFDVIQAPTAFKAERTNDASPHFRFWHIASESRHALPVSVAIGPETDFGCARRQCCPVQVAGPPDRMPPIEPWGANMRRRRARSVVKGDKNRASNIDRIVRGFHGAASLGAEFKSKLGESGDGRLIRLMR
jgi:hypothetical protein